MPDTRGCSNSIAEMCGNNEKESDDVDDDDVGIDANVARVHRCINAPVCSGCWNRKLLHLRYTIGAFLLQRGFWRA